MISCIAVDDEPLALNLLADNISKMPFLNLVARCEDAFEAARILQERTVELIFIDIQMPGLTGLQFIESLASRPMVIIVTAYKEFALEGYSLNVVDYLVKPVSLDRFMKACNKCLELYALRKENRQVNAPPPTYMFLNVGYSLLKVMFDDIVWIEGLKDYVQIHLKSTPKPVIVRLNVKGIEEQLPANDFLRIHKSFIVSVNEIREMRKTSVVVGEKELPVGETYRDSVMRIGKGF